MSNKWRTLKIREDGTVQKKSRKWHAPRYLKASREDYPTARIALARQHVLKGLVAAEVIAEASAENVMLAATMADQRAELQEKATEGLPASVTLALKAEALRQTAWKLAVAKQGLRRAEAAASRAEGALVGKRLSPTLVVRRPAAMPRVVADVFLAHKAVALTHGRVVALEDKLAALQAA